MVPRSFGEWKKKAVGGKSLGGANTKEGKPGSKNYHKWILSNEEYGGPET